LELIKDFHLAVTRLLQLINLLTHYAKGTL